MTRDQNLMRVCAAFGDSTRRPRALRALQAFLDEGGDPDCLIVESKFTFQLLCNSAECGWDDAVRVLLAAGADVHTEHDAALRWAAHAGHACVVDRLLAAGADVHALGDDALQWAGFHGNLSVVERLLAAGASAVSAANNLQEQWKQSFLKNLDTIATAIPVDQREALLACSMGSLPVMESLAHAEQRRTSRDVLIR